MDKAVQDPVGTRRIALLGVEFDLLDVEDLNREVIRAVEADERIVIANHNLHSVSLYQREPVLRDFFDRADIVHVDGMSLIAFANLLGYRVERRFRVTYLDWYPSLMTYAAARGWKLFYLGAAPGVAALGTEKLETEFPGLRAFHRHGFFGGESSRADDREVLQAIRSIRPQILMVGMGMPRQEMWVHEHRDAIEANVILTSGGFIDYIAGSVPEPPRWTGRMGLEWLFRFAAEPTRLGKRYLVEPWSLLPLALRDLKSKRPRRKAV